MGREQLTAALKNCATQMRSALRCGLVQQPPRLPWRVLARRDGQKPDQQTEQEQGTNQGKQGMQRVELEIGIAIEAISCREHKTSLARVTGANGRPV